MCLWSWASTCLLQPWEELWSPYRYWWEGIINKTEKIFPWVFLYQNTGYSSVGTLHKSCDTAGNGSQNPGFLNKVRIKTCEVLRIEKWSQLTGYKWKFYNYRKNGSHWKKNTGWCHKFLSPRTGGTPWRWKETILDSNYHYIAGEWELDDKNGWALKNGCL